MAANAQTKLINLDLESADKGSRHLHPQLPCIIINHNRFPSESKKTAISEHVQQKIAKKQ